MNTLKILFFGDIVGRRGRLAVAEKMPEYQKKHKPDIVIANAENLAHGFGITTKAIEEMQEAGIDFFTSGNHIWKKKEGLSLLLEPNNAVIRPHNYPPMNPGLGYKILNIGDYKILVINLLGRVFMKEMTDCPFRGIDEILKKVENEPLHAIFVDFHAEATSEKSAFFHYVDGRVSAAVGTHTHVATADARVTETGTALITDVGMCGAKDSVIGHKKLQIIQRFLTQIDTTHEVEEEGGGVISAVLITIDPRTKKAIAIKSWMDEVL